jgi:hypothetical protein
MKQITSAEQLPTVPPIVAEQRARYVEQVTGGGFIAFAGGCSLTEERTIIRREGDQLAALQTDSLATGQRLNPWKKRSAVAPGQPVPYSGLESVMPDTAFDIVREQALSHGSAVLEVGLPHHTKYIPYASTIWWGARSKDPELLRLLALYDPRVLFCIKNPLDGDLNKALGTIDGVNEERQRMGERLGIEVAPAILIYRGSDNARTPAAWRNEREKALIATEGMMVDDFAHGTMRAHHPDGRYDKSVEGQERAWEHGIALAEEGLAGVGAKGEASDTRVDVDPHMGFDKGLNNIRRIHEAKMAGELAVAA